MKSAMTKRKMKEVTRQAQRVLCLFFPLDVQKRSKEIYLILLSLDDSMTGSLFQSFNYNNINAITVKTY